MNHKKEHNQSWRKVKFGDVVRLSKARCADPLAEGVERFVGLEHLEPGDLRIRTWGNVADGVTFTSVFKPGQVLFGKRRAYQRKVAVADFSGVCSGDIYVLESQDANVLMPELLPYICQTDAFFDHAVGTSAGSLSPRTNWSSMADFEFALPSISEQIDICVALNAVTEAMDAYAEATESARILHKSVVDGWLSWGSNQKLFTRESPVLRSRWKYISIETLCSEIVDCLHRTPNYSKDGYIAVRTADLEPGILNICTAEKVPVDEYLLQISRLKPIPGDILFSREGERMGMAAQVPQGIDLCISQRMMHLRAKQGFPPNLVMEYLNSGWVQRQLLAFTTGSTSPHVNVGDVRRFRVPLPPESDWSEFSRTCEESLSGLVSARKRLTDVRNLAKLSRERILAETTETGHGLY